MSGVGLGGLLAALSAAAALLTLGGGDHRHPEEAAASKVSRKFWLPEDSNMFLVRNLILIIKPFFSVFSHNSLKKHFFKLISADLESA